MTATTPTRRPLTSTTWAGLLADRSYLSRDYAAKARLFWPNQSDLGHELAELVPGLDLDSAHTLVDMTVSALPIILTWTVGEETTTAAVIVEYMSARAAYVRYCGFGHWVPLADVTDARVFDTVRTWAAQD